MVALAQAVLARLLDRYVGVVSARQVAVDTQEAVALVAQIEVAADGDRFVARRHRRARLVDVLGSLLDLLTIGALRTILAPVAVAVAAPAASTPLTDVALVAAIVAVTAVVALLRPALTLTLVATGAVVARPVVARPVGARPGGRIVGLAGAGTGQLELPRGEGLAIGTEHDRVLAGRGRRRGARRRDGSRSIRCARVAITIAGVARVRRRGLVIVGVGIGAVVDLALRQRRNARRATVAGGPRWTRPGAARRAVGRRGTDLIEDLVDDVRLLGARHRLDTKSAGDREQLLPILGF